MSHVTPSDTSAAFSGESSFQSPFYIDIGQELNDRPDIMDLYQGESSSFSFSCNAESICALARLRGSRSGYHAAKVSMLLREHHER